MESLDLRGGLPCVWKQEREGHRAGEQDEGGRDLADARSLRSPAWRNSPPTPLPESARGATSCCSPRRRRGQARDERGRGGGGKAEEENTPVQGTQRPLVNAGSDPHTGRTSTSRFYRVRCSRFRNAEIKRRRCLPPTWARSREPVDHARRYGSGGEEIWLVAAGPDTPASGETAL